MKKIQIEEVTTYQEYTGADGDRYKVVRKVKDVMPPHGSGLHEVLYALLAFSTVGLLICLSWTFGLRLVQVESQAPPKIEVRK